MLHSELPTRRCFAFITTLLLTALVSPHIALAVVISFEDHQLGALEGQGRWLPPDVGTNEFDVVPSETSGEYRGGLAIRPNGFIWDVVEFNEVGSPLPEAIATWWFGQPFGYSADERLTFSFDLHWPGRQGAWMWLSDGTDNVSPAFGVFARGFYFRYGGVRAYRESVEREAQAQPGDWIRISMTLDQTAQKMWLNYRNLTTGWQDHRAFSDTFNDTDLTIFGPLRFDVRKWDRLHIGWRFGFTLIDNITIAQPIPEPQTASLVGAAVFYAIVPFSRVRRQHTRID